MRTPSFVKKWHIHGLVRVACYLAVVSLLLMIWSVVVPTALPVVIGMSLGQGIGALAFLSFVTAILLDARRLPALPPPEADMGGRLVVSSPASDEVDEAAADPDEDDETEKEDDET